MKEGKPSVYILGASGFLGSRCADYFHQKGFKVFEKRVDVGDLPSLRYLFTSIKPDVAINLTGPPAYPTIDWCETHKEETARMIVSGPINFSLAAIEAGVYPIQITSGCIYNGGAHREFTEDDEPNFFGSFYSRMRIAAQKALAELPVLQARIRMPISEVNHERNFINKITGYRQVISIPNSVTLIEDLWPALERLMNIRPVGILNLTNDGYIEHSQVLSAYREFVDQNHRYELIDLERLQGPGGITRAKRSNCVLATDKARSLGISMPVLDKQRLEELMKRYAESARL